MRLLVFVSLIVVLTEHVALAQASNTVVQGSTLKLEKLIDDAYYSGEKKIVVPRGIYRQDREGQDAVSLSGLKDFEIDMAGVTVVSTDLRHSILRLESCANVTLLGGTFLHETPPFSQGQIEAVSADRSSVDVRITKGYSTNIDSPTFVPNVARWLNLLRSQNSRLGAWRRRLGFWNHRAAWPGSFPLSYKFKRHPRSGFFPRRGATGGLAGLRARRSISGRLPRPQDSRHHRL